MTILIPQYRTARRAAAAGATPITVNQTVTGTASVTFTGVAAGELLVVIATGTNAITTPSGFSVAINANNDPSNGRALMFTKTASGSEGTVTLTGAAVSVGYRLSHGTVSFTENDGVGVTSINAGASALDAVAGSVMFAAVGFSGNTSVPAAGNSFSIDNSGARGIVAHREYASADTAENCTLSWTSARNASSFLALISP